MSGVSGVIHVSELIFVPFAIWLQVSLFLNVLYSRVIAIGPLTPVNLHLIVLAVRVNQRSSFAGDNKAISISLVDVGDGVATGLDVGEGVATGLDVGEGVATGLETVIKGEGA